MVKPRPNFRVRLQRSYEFANIERPQSEGEWMMRAYPGRFKNEEAAYQAYHKTVTGKRTGERLNRAAEVDRTMMLRGKRVPRGATEEGLWKVIVHFNFIDSDGNLVEDQEISFNAASSQHDTLLSVPYLEDALLPTAEMKLAEAARQSFDDAQITYIEVIPIHTYRKEAVDLDEINI